jgi:type IV secretion system protein VirD4
MEAAKMQLRSYALQSAAIALVNLICLWGATQWVAYELGYQSALGAPLVTVLGLPITPPWMLIPWWLNFGPEAPKVFDMAGGMVALCAILSGGFAFGGAARRASQTKAITTYGSARWADVSDITAAGLLSDDGVILGLHRRRYLRHSGPEHVMVVAPTRSGKGVGLVVPTLLSWTGSAVIHDVKGENWTLTAGWRSKFSHCMLFDPTDPRSARFNPLMEVRQGPNEVRDVQNIADILVDPEGARDRRDHWEKTAHALLVGAILHVLHAEPDKTLAGVATFLADPARSIEATLQIMFGTNHLGTATAPQPHPVVASVARELKNKSDNERSGVVSTAVSFLALYRDPVIAAITAKSDWRIADLMAADHPVSLYLVVPPSDISRTRPLMRLILNQIGRRLTESLDTVDGLARQHPLLLMLDEFPALGRLDFFETSLAFLAGYGIRAFLVAQSLHQLDKAYGLNHSLLDNCHVRVAFAPNDERTAKRLSDALGTATELRSLQNLSGKRSALWLSNVAVSKQETPRPLLTPGEVLQLPRDEALVLVSGVPPIRAGKLRYFDDPAFKARQMSAPQLTAGPFADLPPPRADPWAGRVAALAAPPPQPTAVSTPHVPETTTDDPRPRTRAVGKKPKALERQLDFPFSGSRAAKAATKDRDTIPSGSEPDPSLGPVVRLPGGVNLG